MFPGQTVSAVGAPTRRGPRGLSHGLRGLGDDGPLGIPGVYAYTLGNGNTVYLPSEWNSMSTPQKLLWIEASDLSSADAIQLENEAGVSTPTSPGYDPFSQYPNAGASGSPRPSVAYVRAGDVIRVTIPLPTGFYTLQDQVLTAIARALNGTNMRYISGTVPGWFGGAFTIDVQSLGDRNSINDVASDVWSIAQSAGNVWVSGPPTASFISKNDGGGATPAPGGSQAGNQTPPDPVMNWLQSTFGRPSATTTAGVLGLSSGVLLAGGAAILLLVLAKK